MEIPRRIDRAQQPKAPKSQLVGDVFPFVKQARAGNGLHDNMLKSELSV